MQCVVILGGIGLGPLYFILDIIIRTKGGLLVLCIVVRRAGRRPHGYVLAWAWALGVSGC